MKIRGIYRFFFKAVLAVFLFTVLQVVVLKWVPVWYTPLMLKRSIEFRGDDTFSTRKKWVPLEEISKNLPKALITSEDNLFFTHDGFAWEDIRKELEHSKKAGRQARGCSTISQQTAKNVFTSGNRSFLRKGIEMYYTFLIEKIWGKRRILEVYLNVIETGRGIYGAEAAAQEFFNKSASKLTLSESALIAACLPNPLKRNVAKPSSYMLKRRSQISSLSKNLDWKNLDEAYNPNNL